jgi:hypothetical protein
VTDTKKLTFVRIEFTECDRGGLHVISIEPIDETAIVYDAPGSDEILASSSVGWSRPYAENWARNFGAQADETN